MSTPFTDGFFTARDHLKLYYRFFQPPGSNDTMIIVHGHGEHIGRYEKFFQKIPEISIACFDQRGSGRSGGRPAYVESLEDYINDLSDFMDFLKKEYPLPGRVILLGHSLGGLVALHWALRCYCRINALILSSPCLGLSLPFTLIELNRFLNRYFPKFDYQGPVYPPHLSHDPEEIKQYKKDPLIRRKISVRLVDQMLTYGAKLDTLAQLDLPIPVYFFLAELEKVVDGKKSCSIFEKIRAPLKEVKLFEGFYHEIFNEIGQDEVFQALRKSIRSIWSFYDQ